MKNNKLQIVNTVLLVIILLLLVAILTIQLTQLNRDSQTHTQQPSGTVDTIDGVQIETPYCTLSYPSEWSEYLEYEQTTTDGVVTQTFYCCIKEQRIEMFKIHFGSEDTGSLIGYLTVDGEKVPFSVESSAFVPDDTWTKTESDIYYVMTEGINDVIRSVTENANYSEE